MGLFDKLRTDASNPNAPDAAIRVLDPVCGMRIRPERAAGTSQHESQTIHFCSINCKNRFDAEPSKYLP